MRFVIVALVALAVGAGIGYGVGQVMDSGENGESGGGAGALRGVVVLDGAVNGCAGEQITVQVRDAGGVVGSELVDSALEGADCVFRFSVPTPQLDCYRLHVDGSLVGSYPDSALRPEYNVGYIIADNAQPQGDFTGC